MFTRRINTFILEDLMILIHYGPFYLSEEELRRKLKWRFDRYYRFLGGGSLFKKKGKEFWQYHRNRLKQIDHPMSTFRLLWSSAVCAYNKLHDLFKVD